MGEALVLDEIEEELDDPILLRNGAVRSTPFFQMYWAVVQ